MRLFTTATCLTLGAMLTAGCADGDTGEDIGHAASAMNGGIDDANSPQANVVVRLLTTSGLCTGTLISPRAVLTAKHCVTGTSPLMGGVPRATFPITVQIGNPRSSFVSVPASTATNINNDDPVQWQEQGADLAIVFLDAPVLELDLDIRRPSLTSPTLFGGDDSEGGFYHETMGMAGWSPNSNHDPNVRQVGFANELYHYPMWPNWPSGQVWVRDQTWLHLEGGDSGGPLFRMTAGGGRDVIGVASANMTALPFEVDGLDCIVNQCDVWSDVTRGLNADFIRDTMVDDRTSIWRSRHGVTSHWKGEVEYLGPCRIARDADCDHWFDEHDNCPATANPGQEDSNDDGLGDACLYDKSFDAFNVLDSGSDYFGDLTAVVKDGRGRLQFFAQRGDYQMMRFEEVGSSSSFGPPIPLGGGLAAWYAPAAARNGDGRVELFLANSALSNQWETQNQSGTWTGFWNTLGAQPMSAPSVIATANGTLEMYVRSANGSLERRRQANNWAAEPMCPWCVIMGRPAIAMNGDTRLEVFVRGTDDGIHHQWQLSPGGPWSGYYPLGGVVTSDPVVGRHADGTLQFFARGTDGAIWTRVQTLSGWSGWHSLGGWAAGAPAVAMSDGGLTVFVRGGDGRIHSSSRIKSNLFAWNPWTPIDGTVISDPVVGQRRNGKLTVFAVNAMSRLMVATQP